MRMVELYRFDMTDSERIKRLQERIFKMDIVGGAGVTVRGSLAEGYAIHANLLSGGGTGAEPFFPVTGACCFEDGSCEVLTEFACTAGGGTYQGDDPYVIRIHVLDVPLEMLPKFRLFLLRLILRLVGIALHRTVFQDRIHGHSQG